MVETHLVGERSLEGKATEYVRSEAKEVEHRVKEMPHGDRAVVVHDVDVEEYTTAAPVGFSTKYEVGVRPNYWRRAIAEVLTR